MADLRPHQPHPPAQVPAALCRAPGLADRRAPSGAGLARCPPGRTGVHGGRHQQVRPRAWLPGSQHLQRPAVSYLKTAHSCSGAWFPRVGVAYLVWPNHGSALAADGLSPPLASQGSVLRALYYFWHHLSAHPVAWLRGCCKSRVKS